MSSVAPRRYDAILLALGQREQLLHQVDAGNPLGQWIAKKTRGPDHGLAVGGHELGLCDRLPEARVGAKRHDLCRVERHVLQKALFLHGYPAKGDRFGHPHAVDLAPEHERAISEVAGHVATVRCSLLLSPTTAAARIAAARQPACPSHRWIGGGAAGGERRMSAIARGSSPSNVLVPSVSVIGPLGVRPERVARDAESGRLLLDPA